MSEKEGKYIMQAEEFINIVYNSGYATKKNAKKYTEKHPKDSYSDQDFIDVYRFNEEKKEIDHTHCTMSPIMNGKTTAFRNGIRGNNSSGQDWIGEKRIGWNTSKNEITYNIYIKEIKEYEKIIFSVHWNYNFVYRM